MVDFNKKIKSSNKFRGPALQFIKTGQYCTYPEGTTEFYKFNGMKKEIGVLWLYC